MTGPNEGDDGGVTRPISVAELLAKNGTIGAAPPSGGRRRRRKGNSDAVTVAELTGEIPIYRTGAIPIITQEDDVEAAPPAATEATVEASPESPAAAARAADTAHTNGRATVDAPHDASPKSPSRPPSPPELAPEPTPRRGRDAALERSNYPRPGGFPRIEPVVDAEQMSPDPIGAVDEADEDTLDPELESDLDARDDTSVDGVADELDAQPDELGIGDASYLQSYLRSTSGPLYGGQTVADDLARRSPDDAELLTGDLVGEEAEVAEALEEHDDDAAVDETGELSRGQMVLRGALIALQSIIAVVFGAGLFIAFDQLWKWNNIVALVLSVLVILGLVVGVRVVRKTEDIASTLIAVAVGALVTLGPLALLQSN
ncbi:hypothetical protein [Mycolicibacterium komossense]|uniref:Transmembrane protein n=1 Tax=Mycolicibacterium komossense TaxID=1779 RepID=A0ABT3CL70_9MYCO|nr:hypothetical protein [Mycolicibacterium komossense]MCV7230288.1 hypothetical protein [Mycolicibacterium komossense]